MQQDESLTDTSNMAVKATDLAADQVIPPVALKLVEVQLMIKGKPTANADEVAQTVYAEFKKQDWPKGGDDAELQAFILSYANF